MRISKGRFCDKIGLVHGFQDLQGCFCDEIGLVHDIIYIIHQIRVEYECIFQYLGNYALNSS